METWQSVKPNTACGTGVVSLSKSCGRVYILLFWNLRARIDQTQDVAAGLQTGGPRQSLSEAPSPRDSPAHRMRGNPNAPSQQRLQKQMCCLERGRSLEGGREPPFSEKCRGDPGNRKECDRHSLPRRSRWGEGSRPRRVTR